MRSPDEIAAHTAQMLRELRSAPSASAAKETADRWFAWAQTARVCAAIRSHVSDATTETIGKLKAQRAQARNVTGERDDA